SNHLSTGPLWVACNDDWNAVGGNGYTDNKGSITIEIILYSEFLQELTDEKTMQSFIETFSYKVGIDTIEKLQEAIKNNSDKLLLLSSESSTSKVGQYAVEDSTLANV
ncbi:MAG TPA: hypothetical protein PLU10_09490, partial [Chitinophagaceae bacterium]|nr:hypothetical protein [Chitinophagaceae bacterium]